MPFSCDSELCIHDVDVCVPVAENIKKDCICSQKDRLGSYLRVLCNVLCVKSVIVTFSYYVGQLIAQVFLDLIWHESNMDCWFGSHAWERVRRQFIFVSPREGQLFVPVENQ